MNESQRAQFAEYRRLLDELERSFALVNEDAFNSSAEIVNKNSAAFRVWLADADYQRGDVRIDPADGVPYWAMHAHGISSGHVCQPGTSPTMWVHCHGTTPETARPFVSEGHNPYRSGHYCTENGAVFLCLANNTVHAPSVLPDAWKQVEKEE